MIFLHHHPTTAAIPRKTVVAMVKISLNPVVKLHIIRLAMGCKTLSQSHPTIAPIARKACITGANTWFTIQEYTVPKARKIGSKMLFHNQEIVSARSWKYADPPLRVPNVSVNVSESAPKTSVAKSHALVKNPDKPSHNPLSIGRIVPVHTSETTPPMTPNTSMAAAPRR